MAFIYPNIPTEELSDDQIFTDVIKTQAEIEAKIREMLPNEQNTSLGGRDLVLAFYSACKTVYFNRNKELISLNGDFENAWIKYEHFERLGKPDNRSTSLYLREKHRDYNYFVMPYYDYFKLPLEKRLAKLSGAS